MLRKEIKIYLQELCRQELLREKQRNVYNIKPKQCKGEVFNMHLFWHNINWKNIITSWFYETCSKNGGFSIVNLKIEMDEDEAEFIFTLSYNSYAAAA